MNFKRRWIRGPGLEDNVLTEYEMLYNNVQATEPQNRAWESFSKRNELRTCYGFAILTEKAIKQLKPYAPFIEVGSGNGYWAYEMQKRGIEIVATDLATLDNNEYKFNKHWTDIKTMTAKQAIKKHPNHTLLIVWPCYNKPWAYQALKTYKGDTLVFCGEGFYGCTGDAAFHELMDAKWKETVSINIPQWFGIHDHLGVFTRI